MTSVERHDGYATTFASLFSEASGDVPAIARVRIPLIQRDYAQGRSGRQVEEIRDAFLDVLHDAVVLDRPVSLDFVYGDVDDDGTLLPLDGQQRLTTLFLLHWFLCVRSGGRPTDHAWRRFSYDTRPSARRFCERIAAHPPRSDQVAVADWIVDQPWFLHGWRNDPTISSMLTMLAAIERRFEGVDASVAFGRLLDRDRPAVSFLLLPIDEVGAGDELYIKMNSRGKPLTPFEHFKARVEQAVAWSPDRADELAHKIDGTWSDILWPLRGDDDIVDDEFMRLIEFVVEVCEWQQDDLTNDGRLLHQRAAALFGRHNDHAVANLEVLFKTFDVWDGYEDVAATFAEHFSTQHRPAAEGEVQSVVLFGTDVRPELFAECCENYGRTRGNVRVFPLTQTLLLFAVLQHRIHGTADFPRRLRILRNLLAGSVDEVRRGNMPKLVRDTSEIVLASSPSLALDRLRTFTKALVAGEQDKLDFLEAHPEAASTVHRLEDHQLLRGSLSAFDLDEHHLARRAEAFDALFGDPSQWASLTGALLAAGEYQRARPNSYGWQFGTGSPANDAVWRTLFTGPREELAETRRTLAMLLDAYDESGLPSQAFLESFAQRWVEQQRAEGRLDWRYYLVAYPCMREGATGIYFGSEGELGYSLCMLRRTQLNSNYRDPFLLAIWRQSEVGDAVQDPWFTGYPVTPRWMELRRSATGLRAVESAIALRPPTLEEHRSVFDRVCADHESVTVSGDDYLVLIRQASVHHESTPIDVEDRVEKTASVLRALVDAGL